MKKHSNCECNTESNHTCQCDKVESHSCHSDCSCASSGAPKSEYNNQWASPAGVKAEVEEIILEGGYRYDISWTLKRRK